MGRGSSQVLYTVANVMEVYRQDLVLGKSAQMWMDQQMLFRLENDPDDDGRWEFVGCTPGVFLVLSESPRVASGEWGLLLQARALGRGEIHVRYRPFAEGRAPREYTMEVSVRR